MKNPMKSRSPRKSTFIVWKPTGTRVVNETTGKNLDVGRIAYAVAQAFARAKQIPFVALS